MDEAGNLEEGGINSAEVDRDYGDLRFPCEEGGVGAPGFVADFCGAEFVTRDFAGGEDGEEAAGFEVGEGGAEGGAVLLGGFFSAEGVDGDDVVADLGDGEEEVVGEELGVWPEAGEEIGEDDGIGSAEGVVGDDEGSAGFGDAEEATFIGGVGEADFF